MTNPIRQLFRTFFPASAKVLVGISSVTMLLASAAQGDFLFERNSHEVLVASNSLAYICSVEHDDGNLATVGLREIDLTTGTVGPREIVYTQVAGDEDGRATMQYCSLDLSADGEDLVVAHDINQESLFADNIRVATKDLSQDSWSSIVYSITELGGIVPSFNQPNVLVRELNGSWMLLVSLDDGSGNVLTNALRFASLADLQTANSPMLAILSPSDGVAIPRRLAGSFFAVSDESVDAVRFGDLRINAPQAVRLGEVPATGDPSISLNRASVYLNGPDFGEMSARISEDRYFNSASGNWTHVVLLPPFFQAGYRLVLIQDTGQDNGVGISLVDPAGPYATGPNALVPEVYGFPFTMDVLLSSADEWVFASRDVHSDLLALYRIAAEFDPDPETVKLGTRLPGAEFCGAAMSASYAEDSEILQTPYVFNEQNNFVSMKRLPNGTDFLVVYLSCPDGNPANAELTARILPIDFPKLVDDDAGSTPRGQFLEVAAPGLLANDSELGGGTPSLHQQAAHGYAVVNADGSYSYSPQASWCGPDEFFYEVTKDDETYIARVTVNVTCDLALWWTFDELEVATTLAENDRIEDSSSNNRDGHVYLLGPDDGPTVVTGAPATNNSPALDFFPDSELVRFVPGFSGFTDAGPSAGDGFDIEADTSFTVEVIARTHGTVSENQILANKYGAGFNGWFLQVSPSGVLTAVLADGTNVPNVSSPERVDDGEWHHFAMVRDAVANTLSLFVDGVRVAITTDTTTGSLAASNPFAIAAYGADGDFERQFDGTIDEVRVMLEALGPSAFLQGFPVFSDGFESP